MAHSRSRSRDGRSLPRAPSLAEVFKGPAVPVKYPDRPATAPSRAALPSQPSLEEVVGGPEAPVQYGRGRRRRRARECRTPIVDVGGSLRGLGADVLQQLQRRMDQMEGLQRSEVQRLASANRDLHSQLSSLRQTVAAMMAQPANETKQREPKQRDPVPDPGDGSASSRAARRRAIIDQQVKRLQKNTTRLVGVTARHLQRRVWRAFGHSAGGHQPCQRQLRVSERPHLGLRQSGRADRNDGARGGSADGPRHRSAQCGGA